MSDKRKSFYPKAGMFFAAISNGFRSSVKLPEHRLCIVKMTPDMVYVMTPVLLVNMEML